MKIICGNKRIIVEMHAMLLPLSTVISSGTKMNCANAV